MMRYVARLFVPALTFLSSLSAPNFAATIYNASSDFSYASNPNGVWSYNVGSSPLPFVQVGWGGVPGETFWATTLAGTVPPAWAKAATTPAGSTDWLPGDVIVHASNSGSAGADQGNITWSSPGAGLIDISGKAWDAVHAAGRDDAWNLSLNGDVLASRPGIVGVLRGDAAANFANNLLPLKSLTNLTVQAGDVLKFEVQKTSGCCGHFSALELTVSFVPEPPASLMASLMFSSLFSSVVCRRRSPSYKS